jgi:hypothetical protein
MPRECRKCNKVIPYNIVVDGKVKNLQNRKFCLECSPFGAGNNCVKEPFVKSRKSDRWEDCSPERKEMYKISLYYRGLRRRRELYDLLGGKCQKCGYNKCDRALSFHHRNRSEKSFCLTLNHLWSKKQELVNDEVVKCDLLCLNCHAELEDSIARAKNGIVKKVNEKYGTNF